jgi:hypothetical protein
MSINGNENLETKKQMGGMSPKWVPFTLLADLLAQSFFFTGEDSSTFSTAIGKTKKVSTKAAANEGF